MRDYSKIKRLVKIGDGITGKLNNLCDVPGIRVGHYSLNEDDYHTGVTVISPHPGNIFREKVVASSFVYNGFGKSMGLVQIEELGTIETNIALTGTLCIDKIASGVIEDSLMNNPEIGYTTGSVNPIVLECNDSDLNKARDRILSKEDYFKALNALDTDFLQGNVGAGCGMTCHGFKGGIGSSSRIINIDGTNYTIAILCNSNFGTSNGKDLIFKGRPLGDAIKEYNQEHEDKGSIVCVFATDIPLNERQIKRVLKRIEIGIGRTGSYAGNGSGDLFIGFTTANKRQHFTDKAITASTYLSDEYINQIFKRTVEMTEEAVLNSMLYSHTVKGYQSTNKSLMEYKHLFNDLLEKEAQDEA